MKKILGVSLVSILTALPMVAGKNHKKILDFLPDLVYYGGTCLHEEHRQRI